MDSKKLYSQDGYQKGLIEGKRTGGKVNKKYVDNYLNDETQSLCSKDALEFMKAWHKGFADGVLGLLDNMVKQEGLVKNRIYNLE
jgi:hypothetical protein